MEEQTENLKVSIISVVHKDEVFQNYLKPSIDKQKGVDIELIVVDNTSNQFSSLSKAFNNGVSKVTNDWIMFIHPDVVFLDNYSAHDLLENVNKSCIEDSTIALWGVAGVTEQRGSRVITTIEQGQTHIKSTYSFSHDYEYVQTVDACCFLLRRDTLREFPFWEELSGYHMAVEELCLTLKENGKHIVTIPSRLWHLSTGASLDYTYYRETRKVIRRHKELKGLRTTGFEWNNTKFLPCILWYYQVRNYIHHIFRYLRRK